MERQNIRHMENRSSLTFRFVGILSPVSVHVNFFVMIVMVDDATTSGLSVVGFMYSSIQYILSCSWFKFVTLKVKIMLKL